LIGTADIARKGGDIGGKKENIRRNMAEMMMRSYANGVWFQVDPDVYYMRKEMSDLNFELSNMLTSTQGLLGTVFLTSDYPDQWNEDAKMVVRQYLNKKGPRVSSMQHIVLTNDGLPVALSVAYENGEYAVGIYNWEQKNHDVSVTIQELRILENIDFLTNMIFPGTEDISFKDGRITIFNQPAESLRIIHFSQEVY
jgi:hypothetical protein